MLHINTGRVHQICIVTKDCEKMGAEWAKILGVDAPKKSRTLPYEITHATYKGKPTDGLIDQTELFFDNTIIEFITPVEGGEPTFWSDWLDKNGDGVHHIAFQTEDMDAAIDELKSMGYDLIQRGEYPAGETFPRGSYAYMGTEERLGVTIELLWNEGLKNTSIK